MKYLSVIFIFFGSFSFVNAQSNYAKQILDSLCSDRYSGRGYVNDGVGLAADFLVRELKRNGIQAFPNMEYKQAYTFGVNTFPQEVSVQLDSHLLNAGVDYLVDANSGTAEGEFEVLEVNSSNYLFLKNKLKSSGQLVVFNLTDLTNKDSIHAVMKLAYQTAQFVPVVYIEKQKMMYTVGRRALNYPLIWIKDSAYQTPKTMDIHIHNQYQSEYENENVIAYLPAKSKFKPFQRKKYLVFSAHFDHLGQMGQAIFPGANDNASGVAMLLSLAKYYQAHPTNYDMVFCFFSGEEAGLEGSKYFVSHPYFKLNKVKFVLNIDIMGAADKGITVVNGTEYDKAFTQLTQINQEKSYLKEIKSRKPTANSDHYFFFQAGVPSFFIYSMGSVTNYHDVNDTAENTPLYQFDEVQHLLIDFVESL